MENVKSQELFEISLGHKLIHDFNMKSIRGKDDLVETNIGSKTARGVGAYAARIVEEEKKKYLPEPECPYKDLYQQTERGEIYTVIFSWEPNQPFVCGSLEDIVKFAIKGNTKGIDGFYEVVGRKFIKVSKKLLKARLSHGLQELSDELFKRY